MRKIPLLLLILVACIFPMLLTAQTADESNEGSKLTWDNANAIWRFTWWGRAGRTYFIQQSGDLLTGWAYVNLIEPGADAVKEWGFTSSGSKFFLRLKYTDIPTSDPWNDDFDGDGVSNSAELAQGTDPLSWSDADTNGLPDDWEHYYFPGQTNIDPNTLTPGGITYLTAFQLGLDPTKADNDGDGVNDGFDFYPKDPNRSEDVAVTSLAALDISGSSTGGQDVATVALDDNGNAAFWNYTESGTNADYHVVRWQNGAITAQGVLPHKIEFDAMYPYPGNWHYTYDIGTPVGVSAGGVVACNGSITMTCPGQDTEVQSGYFTWNVNGGSPGSGGTGNMPSLIGDGTAVGITADGVVWGHKGVRYWHCSHGLNVDLGQVTFIGAREFPEIDVVFDDSNWQVATTVHVEVLVGRFEVQSVSTSGSMAAGIYTPPAAVASKDVVLDWGTGATIPIDDLMDATQKTFKVWTGGEGAGAFQDAFPGHVPDTATHAVATNNDGVTVGTSLYVSGTGTETAFIWQGGTAQKITDILPAANQKQIRNITPLLLSNKDTDAENAFHVWLTADVLEGEEDEPEWVNHTVMFTTIGGQPIGETNPYYPTPRIANEITFKDLNPKVWNKNGTLAGTYVGKAGIAFETEFRARDGKLLEGFDPPIYNDYDEADTGNPPARKGKENPETVPWTRVSSTSDNALTKVFLRTSPELAAQYTITTDSSLITVTPEAPTGKSTDLVIQPTASAGSLNKPTEVRIKLKKSNSVVAEMGVWVMPPRTITLGVWKVSASSNPTATDPGSIPSISEIIEHLNEVYRQACITFQPGTTGTKAINYDVYNPKPADINVLRRPGDVTEPEQREAQAIRTDPDITDKLNIVFVKKIDDCGGFGSLSRNVVFIQAGTKEWQLRTCAHEVGHALGLSDHDAFYEKGNNPAPKDIQPGHDCGPFPGKYYRDSAQRGIMWWQGGNANWKWIRNEDWVRANRNADTYYK